MQLSQLVLLSISSVQILFLVLKMDGERVCYGEVPHHESEWSRGLGTSDLVG